MTKLKNMRLSTMLGIGFAVVNHWLFCGAICQNAVSLSSA